MRGAVSIFLLATAAQLVAQTAGPQDKLQYTVIMSRHGVRSFLTANEKLDEFSVQPWPKWDVPIGYQTKHGRTLMGFMGDYYREYLTQQALLPKSGCAAAGAFYFWSDTDQRDIDTGHALAERMFRGCPVEVYTVAEGKVDPLFVAGRSGLVTTAAAAPSMAALTQAIGGPPEVLVERNRKRLEALQKVLLGCGPVAACMPQQIAGRKLLLEQPSVVQLARGVIAELVGPMRNGSEYVDDFLLEYTEGLPMKDVGWGRVGKAALMDFLNLQMAYIDLTLRTPYLARAGGSNLMSHILRSMEQAVKGATVEGSLGKPGDKGLVLLGHDSNESQLGGILNAPWKLPEYPANIRPPGSAMIFELWKNAAGAMTVKAWFVSQTLDQMRNAVPLSVKAPPLRVPLNIPGCGTACDWDTFRALVEKDIDPTFVSNRPLQ